MPVDPNPCSSCGLKQDLSHRDNALKTQFRLHAARNDPMNENDESMKIYTSKCGRLPFHAYLSFACEFFPQEIKNPCKATANDVIQLLKFISSHAPLS